MLQGTRGSETKEIGVLSSSEAPWCHDIATLYTLLGVLVFDWWEVRAGIGASCRVPTVQFVLCVHQSLMYLCDVTTVSGVELVVFYRILISLMMKDPLITQKYL